MWGNFMDKAKEMAANIDQQINESVGMETTTNTSSTLTMKNDYDDANNENENAWNDDFEFDDDDDDDADAVVKTISPSDSAIMVGATPVKETDEHKPMVETMEPPPQPHESTTADLKPKESINHQQQQEDENPTAINDAVASVSNMVKTVAPASLSSMLMNPTTVMKTKMTEVAENNHKTTTTTTTTASSFLFSTLSGAVNSALDANDKVWEEEANEHVLEQQQEEEEQEEGEQGEMIQDPMVTESATKESISVETTIVTGQEEEQQEQEDSIDVQQADPMPSMQASSTKSEPATVTTTTTTAAVEDEEPKTTTTTITTNNVENDPRYIQLQEELKLRYWLQVDCLGFKFMKFVLTHKIFI